MLCERCGKEVSEEATFCPYCGDALVKAEEFEQTAEAVEKKCAKCGEVLPQGVKFCPNCGEAIVKAEEFEQKAEVVEKKCAKCGEVLSQGVKFCPKCGEKVQVAQPKTIYVRRCTTCGATVSVNEIYCPTCHTLMPPVNTYQKQSNGIAVAGFVCSFFVPILGWIFGGIGLSRSQQRFGKGKGFSIAAIVIASASFVLNLAGYGIL